MPLVAPQHLREVIPDHTDIDGLKFFSKLTAVGNFIKLRSRVKEYLKQKDIEIIALTDTPHPTSAAQHSRCIEAHVKVKTGSTLTLSDGPLDQMSTIVDNDELSAKYLWTELDNFYQISNTNIVRQH